MALLVALAASAWLVVALALSPRRWLLLDDGDSVLPLLVRQSLASGGAQDWALSNVLFVPELAGYLALSAIGLGPHEALLAAGVANLVALYSAFRWVAGALLPERGAEARCRCALVAFGCFVALAATERSADRNALELASLQATTTYYSSCVIVLVVGFGLVVRWANELPDVAANGGAGRRTYVQRGSLFALLAVAGASNPLLVIWIAPSAAAAAGILVVFGAKRASVMGLVTAVTSAGIAAVLIRMAFRDVIVDDVGSKLNPADAASSWNHFSELMAARLATVPGVAATSLTALGIAAAGYLLLTGLRRRELAASVVGAGAVAMAGGALFVTIGLGTRSARYLQPVVLAAILGIMGVLVFHTARGEPARPGRNAPRCRACRRAPATAHGPAAAAVALVAMAACAAAFAQLGALAEPNRDAQCVATWAARHGGVGAGEFWTIRPVMAAASSRTALVQTDSRLNRYAWLVNRHTLTPHSADYLVVSSDSAVRPPAGARAIVPCGRYTIADYRPGSIPLGPAHS